MPKITLNSLEVEYLSERDFRLRHLMYRIGELEYTRSPSAFHSLAHSIIEQMLSMKVGRTIEDRLIERCGGNLSPDALIALSVEEIRACGVSSRKAANLKTLSEYAAENDLEALAKLDDAEVSAGCKSCRVSASGRVICSCSSTLSALTSYQLRTVRFARSSNGCTEYR